MSQGASLSSSSGSNGVVLNEGASSHSFERIGHDKEHDKRILTRGRLALYLALRNVYFIDKKL